jgi:hypothetical protein
MGVVFIPEELENATYQGLPHSNRTHLTFTITPLLTFFYFYSPHKSERERERERERDRERETEREGGWRE